MKIIFENFIKDYVIYITELNIYGENSITGTCEITTETLREIEDFSFGCEYFSIVNDNLRQCYQRCRIRYIAIDNSIPFIKFNVITVGKTSLPIPENSVGTIRRYVAYRLGTVSSTWSAGTGILSVGIQR